MAAYAHNASQPALALDRARNPLARAPATLARLTPPGGQHERSMSELTATSSLSGIPQLAAVGDPAGMGSVL